MSNSDYIANPYTTKPAPRGSAATPFSQLVMQAWLSEGQKSPKTLAEDKAARKAAAEQVQAVALAEWEQLCARISEASEGLTLRALLDEHKPVLGGSWGSPVPACGYCDQIGGWEREGVEWPCPNYAIIKEGMG